MDDSQRYKIISNEYADIIIEYDKNLSLFEQYEDASFNLINDKYAILHIPIANLGTDSIHQFGYSAVPKCFGIMTYRFESPENEFIVRSFPEKNLTGEGVLVGVVDTGIQYMNPIFINEDKTSKIQLLWDQTIDSGKYPEGVFYGTEYTAEDINKALYSTDPNQVVPSYDSVGEGTAIAGIAAGNFAEENGFSGVTTKTQLVIVKLKQAKTSLMEFFGIPNDVLCYQENDILMGVEYLINAAKRLNRPIVICIGMGSSQGSHKGESIMSNYFVENGNRSGIALVVAAGNEGNQMHHYYGEISPSKHIDIVELNVGELDKNFSMELWGMPPNLLSLDIYAPNEQLIFRFKPGISGMESNVVTYQNITIYIDNFANETYAEQQLILFRFKNISSGLWRFHVSGTKDLNGSFHIWLPIYDFISEETYFLTPNPYTTITVPGNSLNTLTVTSYDPITSTLAPSASKGFTSINLPKPDIAAPGVNILAPTTIGDFIPLSGTSLAAAYATGVTAGLLEWGIVRGYFPVMNSTIVRYFLTNSATRSPDMVYPNPDWGFGIIG